VILLKQQILKLKDDNIAIRIRNKKTAEIYNTILSVTKFLPDTAKIKERTYVVLNDIHSNPLCCCGRLLKFMGPASGYRDFCSTVCSNNSQEVQLKKQDTCLTNHGVKIPAKSELIREKMWNTTTERFGVPHSQQSDVVKYKTKETNIKNWGFESHTSSPIFQEQVKQVVQEKYGIDHVSQLPETQEKIKQTNLKKYGVEYAIISPEIQEKIKQTIQQKYGVEYLLASPEIQEKIKQTNLKKYGMEYTLALPETQEKIKQTIQERYGVDHISQRHLSDDALSKSSDIVWLKQQHHTNKRSVSNIANEIGYAQSSLCQVFHRHNIQTRMYFQSTGELELYELIKSIIPNTKIIQGDRSVLGNKELDIYIPSLNLAFEYNGIYWHSELAGKDRTYHLSKTKQCNEQGIRLVHIWDREWILQQHIVTSRINNMLGMSNVIYARKCNIIIPTKQEVKSFMNEHHIQGNVGYSVAYGLKYGDKLMSIMTLGKSRYTTKYEYELIRFATILNTSVTGGASKLFKHFIKKHNPQSIITYSDKRWNTGKLYTKLNFTFINNANPNYFYFRASNTLELFSRQRFQKHKLKNKLEHFNPLHSEWENMINNGYNKIWDCGNDVYVWTNKVKSI
jgi:hypothetical protein